MIKWILKNAPSTEKKLTVTSKVIEGWCAGLLVSFFKAKRREPAADRVQKETWWAALLAGKCRKRSGHEIYIQPWRKLARITGKSD